MKLIALTGMHGAGKDTVADALPARKLAFADVLYREVAEAFSVTVEWLKDRSRKDVPQPELHLEECTPHDFPKAIGLTAHYDFSDDWWFQPRSPRQILQWWGDYRRAQDPEYFVRAVRIEVHVSEWGGKAIVVTDCRFPNEAALVRQLGGQIWQVVRPGHEPPRTGHASETTGDEFAPDVVLVNDGTLDELRAKALKEWNK